MYTVVILREKIQKGREIEGVMIGFSILEEWLQIYSVLRDRLSKKITFEQRPTEVGGKEPHGIWIQGHFKQKEQKGECMPEVSKEQHRVCV